MALVWMHCTLQSSDSELYGGRQGQSAMNGQILETQKQGKNVQTQPINVKAENTHNKKMLIQRNAAISLYKTQSTVQGYHEDLSVEGSSKLIFAMEKPILCKMRLKLWYYNLIRHKIKK